MIVETARAKVNLALHILGRRADGYHELDSIVAFADVGDRLRFEPAEKFELVVDGPFANDVPAGEDNLALRAARALGRCVMPARIHLTKNLPVASGVGGGSADAAAVLRGLTRLAGRTIEPALLRSLAQSLGADVPVCLSSRASRMTGIGERVEEIAGYTRRFAVLVNPMLPLATADVFKELGLACGDRGFAGIQRADDLARCRNDLEAPALRLAPQIGDVLNALRVQEGVTLARMSGSGATCFGLFEHPAAAGIAAERIKAGCPAWWVVATVLN